MIPQILLYFVRSQQTSRASACADDANMAWLRMPLVEDAVGRVHRHGERGEQFIGRASAFLPIRERFIIKAISSAEQVPQSLG